MGRRPRMWWETGMGTGMGMSSRRAPAESGSSRHRGGSPFAPGPGVSLARLSMESREPVTPETLANLTPGV
ncbi:hypothetical protein GCM10010272_24030 [Streptomyces lateritius]|nr:hypothetical protein GCM10010272_24030 [Streptomyces lateritius]